MTYMVQSIPRQGVLVLSSGSASPYEIPSDVGSSFPEDATTHCVVKDTNGDPVADLPGTVFPSRVQYLFMPVDVDAIKRGFNFEVFLVTSDDIVYKLRYGKIVRRENTFEYSATQITQSLLFADNFSGRTGQPGNKYAQIEGNSTIHDNAGVVGIGATGNGLGVNIGGLYQKSSLRINRSLNGDSMRFSCTMVNPYGAATGRTVLAICGNTGLTNGIGLEMNALLSTARVVKINGPNDVDFLTDAETDHCDNFDVYAMDYNDQTKFFNVYKNGSDTPLVDFHDASNVIVHGQGYRYPFFMFNASLLSTGPQVTAWEIQDYVGS